MVTIEGQLFMFVHGNVTAKKVCSVLYLCAARFPLICICQLQIAPLLEKVYAADDANTTLDMMLRYASTKYLASPIAKPAILPSFQWFVPRS